MRRIIEFRAPAPPPSPRPDPHPDRESPFRTAISTATRTARRLGRCRRGVVSVEFVLSCAPLLIMAFGFIATSAVFNTWSNMQSNAQYAARLMSTGQITQNNSGTITSSNATSSVTCGTGIATTKVEYYACTGLPGWASFTVSTTEDCTKPSVTVTLSADAASAAIADIEGFFTGRTITASTTYMKEGSCP